MKFLPSNCQSIGKRDYQQDSFGFSDFSKNHNGVLCVVADGMGGLEHGEKASKLIVNLFLKKFSKLKKIDKQSFNFSGWLSQTAKLVNDEVYSLSKKIGAEDNVGSTLVALWLLDYKAYFVSVGDSRLYLYRDKELHKLSQDHSYSLELFTQVAAEKISYDAAVSDPQFHALTSFIGSDEIEYIDCNPKPIPVKANDRFILCSDGFYNSLDHQEWKSVFADSKSDPQDNIEKLLNLVTSKNKPNQDNATAAMIDVVTEAAPATAEKRNAPRNLVTMSFTGLLLTLAVIGFFYFYDVDPPIDDGESELKTLAEGSVREITPANSIEEPAPETFQTEPEDTVSKGEPQNNESSGNDPDNEDEPVDLTAERTEGSDTENLQAPATQNEQASDDTNPAEVPETISIVKPSDSNDSNDSKGDKVAESKKGTQDPLKTKPEKEKTDKSDDPSQTGKKEEGTGEGSNDS